tara:strand:+ start:686 stop:817 length:132 start_codon:yes stop_codon:yes gene_type:complete
VGQRFPKKGSFATYFQEPLEFAIIEQNQTSFPPDIYLDIGQSY